MVPRADNLNEDILHAIFKCLDRTGWLDFDYGAKRRTLARSARVCKAFHRPAIRVLWQRLEDLIPLFRILPSFAQVGPDGSGGEVFMLSSEVSPEEWDRLKLHASCVASLGNLPPSRRGGPSTGRVIAPAAWAYIARLNAGKPLLPHLLQLTWERIRGDQKQDELSSVRLMVSTALSGAPDLRVLHVNVGTPRMAVVVPLVGRLEKLRKLSLANCKADADALRVAAGKGLTFLYLHEVDLPDAVEPPFCGFTRLEMLVIDVHPTTNRMHEVFSSPHLVDLRIEYYPAVTQGTFLRSCELWARCFPALRRVECSFEGVLVVPPESAAAHVVSSITHVLKHLLPLSTITHLVVNYPEGEFTVDDTDIDNLTQAWPNLAALELGPPVTAFPFGPQPVITESPGVDSLRYLTARCP
ncbi:hypothetical protein C8T65DRAFT_737409 [Cerioporus squamosus]|nr:hypothetical protein C8T65DRAFT_737409 [Cerioporus squamosus]